MQGQGIEPALGGRIGAAMHSADERIGGTDVDDGGLVAKGLQRLAAQAQQSPEHQAEEIVEGLIDRLVDGLWAPYSGIVHEVVEATEALHGEANGACRRFASADLNYGLLLGDSFRE